MIFSYVALATEELAARTTEVLWAKREVSLLHGTLQGITLQLAAKVSTLYFDASRQLTNHVRQRDEIYAWGKRSCQVAANK